MSKNTKKLFILAVVVVAIIILAVAVKFSAPLFVGALTQQEIINQLISYIQQAIEAIRQQIAVLVAQQSEVAQIKEEQPAEPAVVLGCIDSTAVNYNSSANKNDGSCIFSSVILEANRTYFMKTAGEDFILQTLVYETKPNPYYYNKSYRQPLELNYTINGGNLAFLTKYPGTSCAENPIPECTGSSRQFYVKPNIVVPKDSVLNIIDLPDKIAAGAFYVISAVFKGVTTGKIIVLQS